MSFKVLVVRITFVLVYLENEIATLAAASRNARRLAASDSLCPAMISWSNHASRLSGPRWCVSCGNSRGSHDVLRMTSERCTRSKNSIKNAISYISVYKKQICWLLCRPQPSVTRTLKSVLEGIFFYCGSRWPFFGCRFLVGTDYDGNAVWCAR